MAPGASAPWRKGSGDGDVEPDGRTGFPYTGETGPALSTCPPEAAAVGTRQPFPGEGDYLIRVYGIRAFSDEKKKKVANWPTHPKQALAVRWPRRTM